jgi:hypothetical protein
VLDQKNVRGWSGLRFSAWVTLLHLSPVRDFVVKSSWHVTADQWNQARQSTNCAGNNRVTFSHVAREANGSLLQA